MRYCQFCACLLLCWFVAGCSSSKNTNSGGSGSGGGLVFIAPSTNPVFEINGTPQTVTLTVSQPVSTWTVQGGCGLQVGQTPIGSLTNETSTSAVYTVPASNSSVQSCSQAIDTVVATTSNDQSAAMSITVYTAPPLIANTVTFSKQSCPAPGTIIFNDPWQLGVFRSSGAGSGADITVSGGVPPYTWQIVSGSNNLTGCNLCPSGLPNGLSFSPGTNTTNVVISGTPTTIGCSTFNIQVTDSLNVSAQSTTVMVVVPPSIKVQFPNTPSPYNDTPLGTTSPNSGPGVPYPPIALIPSGGVPPYYWCQDPPNSNGSLPPGLQLDSSGLDTNCASVLTSSFGVISGVPNQGDDVASTNIGSEGCTTVGCYPSQIQVYDSQQPYPAVAQASVTFNDLPLSPPPCSPATPGPPIGPSVLNGGIGSTTIPPDSYVQGSFAFLLRGFDANGPVVMAGSVAVDGNGNILGGAEDITRTSGSQSFQIQPTTSDSRSSYAMGTQASGWEVATLGFVVAPNPTTDYSRGCMMLALATSGSTVSTTTFAFSLGGCSNGYTENLLLSTSDNACGMMQTTQQPNTNAPAGYYTTGRIIEFDDCGPSPPPACTNPSSTTRATGIMRLQNTSSFASGLSGAYAFGFSGWDSKSLHYAMAGSFQASGGQLTSAASDIDDGGTLGSQLTGGSGSYGTADPNTGRFTGSLTVGSASLDLTGYLVNPNDAILLTSDALTSAHPVIAGQALSTATSFNTASLQNSHMLHISGLVPNCSLFPQSGCADVSIGVLSFDGVGDVSGTEYEDQAGTLGTSSISGQYVPDPHTGRTSFVSANQSLGNHPFVAYIIPPPANLTRQMCSVPDSCVTGFLVGTDNTAQDGVLEFQTPSTGTPPPFSNRYLEGNYAYGIDESMDAITPNLEGDVFAQPSGTNSTSGSMELEYGGGHFASSFYQDVNYGDPSYYCLTSPSACYFIIPNQAVSGGYSINTNGTGSFGGETISVTNGNVIFYIDESPLNLHPAVAVAEQ